MKIAWNWFWDVVEPIWQRFLKIYDGHKVLTLSLLNAVSLFLFALVALLAWVGDSDEAHATPAIDATEPPASPFLVTIEPEQMEEPDPVFTPAPAPTVAEARRPRQTVKKPAGRREYPVQVRRQLRVYTEDDSRPSPRRTESARTESAHWAEEVTERSDEMRFDP